MWRVEQDSSAVRSEGKPYFRPTKVTFLGHPFFFSSTIFFFGRLAIELEPAIRFLSSVLAPLGTCARICIEPSCYLSNRFMSSIRVVCDGTGANGDLAKLQNWTIGAVWSWPPSAGLLVPAIGF
jgi:hypothetical protein